MILCITEKPSVAKDIASILGANIKCDGYYESSDPACPYKVTWTFGHLCELKEPDDYTPLWKRWSLGALPMLPVKFGIKLKNDKGIEHQFGVIKSLIAEATEVINCGDAGQEGELIQRWVMQKAGIKCPVKRLWISSLTDESIRQGFGHLQPESDFNNLYHAGLSRAIGDWLLGMNATRLYSLKYSSPGKVLSVGRVQTPTLALIVQRQKEINNFKPEDYWELRTRYRDVVFTAVGKNYKTEDEANAVVSRIAELPFEVTGITEKKGSESAPRLFDLTSLQVECNKKWGWTAEESLRMIQSLYEKKVTTYPRVDTTYLSEDLYAKVPEILRNMTPYSMLTASVLSKKLPKSKKVFDNSKVTDHHAIIPTGQSPTVLVGDERKMYHLIALRFIGVFYPDCKFISTTVTGKAGDINFKVTGKVITDSGWRVLYDKGQGVDLDKDADDSEKILPPFTKGESGPHVPMSYKKTTQPPKYYTEGTLLRAMESAGKTVDDEALREAMKENGIGRPSTRAAIIETLFRRRYIYRERKSIRASQAGIDLIATINEELLKSAKLTGIWENKLRRIERGQYSAGEFIDELKRMVSEIVLNVLADNRNHQIIVEDENKTAPEKKKKSRKGEGVASGKPRGKKKKKVENLEDIKCPMCGKGYVLKGNKAYGCSRYAEGCGMRLDFGKYPATLSAQELYDILISEKP